MLLTLTAAAQDFKLFYAKNVTDVTQFRNLNELSNQLHWREVADKANDTNRDDIQQVKDMLSETRMKGLDDQRLFWRMRDEMLLCFRIDDPTDNGSFRVEVIYGQDADGNDIKKTLTTRKYFFANMPLDCKEVSINVYRIKDPTQRINFRYSVFDWDDENVYIFQLDQKRQSTGDTYKMEYVTSYVDAEGDMQSQSQVLELKETKFQSFYVPEGQSLTDVYFLTGNDKEGNVKLRMDTETIHPGIDTDRQLDVPTLSSAFKLAKHENRELINFNWVGTGLFEKYDTLFIKLFNDKGKPVTNAQMNIHRVDEDGRPIDDNTLKYLGYDSKNKQYKVLTYGHPAYVEILHKDYLPLLYRYKGVADKTTKVVSADLCSAKITLRKGSVNTNSIAVSDLYFRYLKDEAISITREGKQFTLMSIDEQNISGKIVTDTLSFMDNGGHKYAKWLDSDSIQTFAQLEIAFSAPSGGNTPQCKLTATEKKSQKEHEAKAVQTNIIKSSEFTRFTRDYYSVRYDMASALPYNQECLLKLSAGQADYDNFPIFLNAYLDEEEQKEEGKKQSENIINPNDCHEDGAAALTDSDLGLQIPLDFKFSLPGFGPVIKTGALFDFNKQMFNVYLNLTWSSDFSHDYWQDARENAKQVQNYRLATIKESGEGRNKKSSEVSVCDPKLKFNDWMLQEMESIFNVQAKHVGQYVQGGGNVLLTGPLSTDFYLRLSEASLFVQGGFGYFYSLENIQGKLGQVARTIREKCDKFFQLDTGINFDANVRFEGGIKSFGAKKKDQSVWDNMGVYANISFNVLLGAWVGVKVGLIPLVTIDAGGRGGLKFQIGGGYANAFGDVDGWGDFGFRCMLVGGVEGYLNIRGILGKVALRAAWRAGFEVLRPDNNHNPFHHKYPYWLPDEDKKVSQRIRNFSPLRTPEPNSLGQLLVNNVNYDADPHFLDDSHVVYNHLGTADDVNDEHISLTTVADGSAVSTEALSVGSTAATRHTRSHRGDKEVVVYQQTTQTINSADITDKNNMAMTDLMLEHTQIKAAIRQSDGTWKQTVVTPDDGFIDKNPVVSVQEDGKAAVVYQHGKSAIIDETESPDSVTNWQFVGELQLRTYDPATGWSAPTPLYDPDIFGPIANYDLIMRNDTVLVGAILENPPFPPLNTIGGKYFRYAWKPVQSDEVSYTWEELNVIDFAISRVGEHNAIAMLYERPDSTREIYVKTVSMNGCYSGMAGSDLGIGRTLPYQLKIISDRDDTDTDDFAVLWTEQSSVARDAENGNKALKDYYTVLNASCIHLTDAPQITYPLTVGSESEGLQMGGFDGYLDDARIKVVYTLTDIDTDVSAIMYNEKEFTNSFESDVTYSRTALLGSSTLPVNVDIINTGTSAIKAATVTINGDEIAIPNVLVQPLQQERYVVQYPIPEDFDGYMQSSVEVEYANVFKIKEQTGRRAAPRSLLRQRRAFPRNRVAAGSIDCNVIGHSVENGVNTFVVEIVDYSSRGLTPGTAVQVGAYVHPSAMETVSSESNTLVHAEDFSQMGAVRKAYAEVVVSGITETLSGYIAAHIVDLDADDDADEEDKRITNTCPTAGPSHVVFHPTGEATPVDSPVTGRPKDHRISITVQEGGVLLGNLEPGEDIRLFNAEGWTVHMEHATSTTHFVPLKRHDIYIVSAANEVFKFTY